MPLPSETSFLLLSKRSTRKEGIISPSKLPIRSGPHARDSSQIRAAEIRMADATTGLGGISNTGNDPHAAGISQPQVTPETEVHILEERVTHAAQKPSTPPQEMPAPPSAPQAKPVAPVPAPEASVVPPKVNPPPQAARFDSAAEDVGLVLQPRDKPAPKIPPTVQPPVSPNLGEPALGDDIAKILAEVKLPE